MTEEYATMENIINSQDILIQASDTDEPVAVDDGAVIRKSEILYSLNSTAMEILALFDGDVSVDNVIIEIERRYPDKDVRKDTEDFINYLFQTGLLKQK